MSIILSFHTIKAKQSGSFLLALTKSVVNVEKMFTDEKEFFFILNEINVTQWTWHLQKKMIYFIFICFLFYSENRTVYINQLKKLSLEKVNNLELFERKVSSLKNESVFSFFYWHTNDAIVKLTRQDYTLNHFFDLD